MIVSAARCASLAPGSPTSSLGALGAALLAGACLCVPAPAAADVGATVSVFTDARFRGLSTSGREPVALLDLSYDDPDGVYVATSLSAVASSGGLRPLALVLNGGYAKRLSSGVTLDFGIVHSEYSHYSKSSQGRSFTELYAGLTHGRLTGRVYLSPHYFESATWTTYGELNGNFGIAPKLNLDGHVGVLIPVRNHDGGDIRPRYDWRLGLTRELGRASVHAAWTGGQGIHHYDDTHPRGGSAFVFGISYPL